MVVSMFDVKPETRWLAVLLSVYGCASVPAVKTGATYDERLGTLEVWVPGRAEHFSHDPLVVCSRLTADPGQVPVSRVAGPGRLWGSLEVASSGPPELKMRGPLRRNGEQFDNEWVWPAPNSPGAELFGCGARFLIRRDSEGPASGGQGTAGLPPGTTRVSMNYCQSLPREDYDPMGYWQQCEFTVSAELELGVEASPPGEEEALRLSLARCAAVNFRSVFSKDAQFDCRPARWIAALKTMRPSRLTDLARHRLATLLEWRAAGTEHEDGCKAALERAASVLTDDMLLAAKASWPSPPLLQDSELQPHSCREL